MNTHQNLYCIVIGCKKDNTWLMSRKIWTDSFLWIWIERSINVLWQYQLVCLPSMYFLVCCIFLCNRSLLTAQVNQIWRIVYLNVLLQNLSTHRHLSFVMLYVCFLCKEIQNKILWCISHEVCANVFIIDECQEILSLILHK